MKDRPPLLTSETLDEMTRVCTRSLSEAISYKHVVWFRAVLVGPPAYQKLVAKTCRISCARCGELEIDQ